MLKKRSFLYRLRAFLVLHPVAIILGSGAFTLTMLAMVGIVLLQGRYDAIAHAGDNSANLALVVERDVTRTFDLFDLSIQAVVDGVQDPGVMRLPPQYRQQLLFDRSATAGEYMGALLYVDERGDIAVDSTQIVPRKINLVDRPWFTAQRANDGVGLYISAPYRSRLRQGQWSIAFSRRVDHPDGSFAGVVVGTLQLDYFRNVLDGLKLGPHGSIMLLQDDGTIIMRNPTSDALIGHSLKGTSNFDRFERLHEPWFFGSAATDGEDRLYIYRHFVHLPLVISVAPAIQDIYAPWQRRARYIIGLAILLAIGLVSTSLLLATEFRHRMEVEANLLLLSRTDGLTGLSNRRTLDDALMREWRRAKRSHRPMSVIFIDIDRFKNYNDTYGHQAGDDALAAVAQTIARSVRRPADTAARYGGEEFVAILPETDLEGASRVANKLHLAIGALQIEHKSSEHRFVTVSIGVASGIADEYGSVVALLKAADEAVYAAKARGRNQTALAAAAHDASADIEEAQT